MTAEQVVAHNASETLDPVPRDPHLFARVDRTTPPYVENRIAVATRFNEFLQGVFDRGEQISVEDFEALTRTLHTVGLVGEDASRPNVYRRYGRSDKKSPGEYRGKFRVMPAYIGSRRYRELVARDLSLGKVGALAIPGFSSSELTKGGCKKFCVWGELKQMGFSEGGTNGRTAQETETEHDARD